MSLSKKVTKLMNRLQRLYMSGIITYPRVDNDFIDKNKAYELYAHPKLIFNSNQNRSLKGETILINKESSLLFLSLLRIVSPANLESFSKTIDALFDDNLRIKDKQNLKMIEKMEIFLKKHNYSQKKIVREYGSLFFNSKSKRKISFYKIENLEIGTSKNSRIYKFMPSFQKTDKKKKESDNKLLDEVDYYGKIKIRKTISDALNEYDRFKKKELEIAEKLLKNVEKLEKAFQKENNEKQ